MEVVEQITIDSLYECLHMCLYTSLPAALWPLGSIQPLTEMSTRNISWEVKAAGALG
jgi:hypothetical protein